MQINDTTVKQNNNMSDIQQIEARLSRIERALGISEDGVFPKTDLTQQLIRVENILYNLTDMAVNSRLTTAGELKTLTMDDVAELLHCRYGNVEGMARRGVIPSIKVPGIRNVIFLEKDVLAWMENNRTKANKEDDASSTTDIRASV